MNRDTYILFMRKTFEEMADLIERKNHDYTSGGGAFANFESAQEFGVDPLVGLCIRMGDKFKRIQTFCQKGELHTQGEGVEDAFKDLIGYSVIALGMLKARGQTADSSVCQSQLEDADRRDRDHPQFGDAGTQFNLGIPLYSEEPALHWSFKGRG